MRIYACNTIWNCNEICENIAGLECAVVLCPEFEYNVVLIHRIEQFKNRAPKIHGKNPFNEFKVWWFQNECYFIGKYKIYYIPFPNKVGLCSLAFRKCVCWHRSSMAIGGDRESGHQNQSIQFQEHILQWMIFNIRNTQKWLFKWNSAFIRVICNVVFPVITSVWRSFVVKKAIVCVCVYVCVCILFIAHTQ